jgi:hypothetical protein
VERFHAPEQFLSNTLHFGLNVSLRQTEKILLKEI